AVLTYDSECLDVSVMNALGIVDTSRLIVEGFEGTDTYAGMYAEEPGPQIILRDLVRDTEALVSRLQVHQDIGAILCECTIFPRVSRRIREATGLPVYD